MEDPLSFLYPDRGKNSRFLFLLNLLKYMQKQRHAYPVLWIKTIVNHEEALHWNFIMSAYETLVCDSCCNKENQIQLKNIYLDDCSSMT